MSEQSFQIGARVQLRPGFMAGFGQRSGRLTGTVAALGEHETLPLTQVIVVIDGDGRAETWHPSWWEPLVEPFSPAWCEGRALAALMVRG